MTDEPLMNFRPQSAEEKLIWLQHEKESLERENKHLKIQLGMLQSEFDELKDLMKTEEKGALILKSRGYKTRLKDLENKIKDLKRENELFLQKIIKLQAP